MCVCECVCACVCVCVGCGEGGEIGQGTGRSKGNVCAGSKLERNKQSRHNFVHGHTFGAHSAESTVHTPVHTPGASKQQGFALTAIDTQKVGY